MPQTFPPTARASTSVLFGLGAMLGAGLFTGLAPAASLAGKWFLPAVALAALAATCSAFSTSDQSAAYPGAGGYANTRAQLGPWPGRLTGAAYLAGHAAAAAALAGTFGNYLVPGQPLLGALALLVAVTALRMRRLTPSPLVSLVLAYAVLAVLVLVVAACFAVPPAPVLTVTPIAGVGGADDPNGLVGAAGLMFLAFVGFERVTAPQEGEQRATRRSIPLLMGIAFVGCLVVGFAAHHQLGSARLAWSRAPLHDAMIAADAAWLAPVVDLGAGIAAVGALFWVLGGMRRTVLAMAETGDLPMRTVRAGGGVEVVGGVLALPAVLLLSPAQAIGMASCCLLFYYAFTNASARLLLQEDRTWPMRTACLGLGLSVLLAMSMPIQALLLTGGALCVGTALTGWSARLGRLRVERAEGTSNES
ncbi:amino acid permease [Solihabitans fulvus]|uniref:Amino acid permease n=1 Tax=Solihabitans fulvus TaxID=1892852 RepID=A0A5B2XN83_9PSEU|nr:APC family permease [Solihabitans fulvus]KAA2264351.1 amino acid permease [Solihabitans fulvus]